jgi:hypothetical protein
VGAKRLLRDRGVIRAELFVIASLQAFVLLLPLSLSLDMWRLAPLSAGTSWRVSQWLVVNVLCFFTNQFVALSLLDMMSSPLSYALATVMKRCTVISLAMLYAARPITPLHFFGITLSIVGALSYQHLGAICPGADARDATQHTYQLVPVNAPSEPFPTRQPLHARGDGACSPV